jgi:hypothetical protein
MVLCLPVCLLPCRELTPLGHLRNFDYAYQGAQEIYAPDAQVLLPGDSLTVQVGVHVERGTCMQECCQLG